MISCQGRRCQWFISSDEGKVERCCQTRRANNSLYRIRMIYLLYARLSADQRRYIGLYLECMTSPIITHALPSTILRVAYSGGVLTRNRRNSTDLFDVDARQSEIRMIDLLRFALEQYVPSWITGLIIGFHISSTLSV